LGEQKQQQRRGQISIDFPDSQEFRKAGKASKTVKT
jgi:hypothetical protein